MNEEWGAMCVAIWPSVCARALRAMFCRVVPCAAVVITRASESVIPPGCTTDGGVGFRGGRGVRRVIRSPQFQLPFLRSFVQILHSPHRITPALPSNERVPGRCRSLRARSWAALPQSPCVRVPTRTRAIDAFRPFFSRRAHPHSPNVLAILPSQLSSSAR
jgi:hypothetical protein